MKIGKWLAIIWLLVFSIAASVIVSIAGIRAFGAIGAYLPLFIAIVASITYLAIEKINE